MGVIWDLGRFLKALAARTTRYFNRLEGRSGTLWESRYKSSPGSNRTIFTGVLPLY